jgi:hypothetical protein
MRPKNREVIKLAKISNAIFIDMAEKGFFDEWKTLRETLEKLAQKGYTIENTKKKGLVAQMLTFLCRKDILTREKMPESEWKKEMGKWRYKKVK